MTEPTEPTAAEGPAPPIDVPAEAPQQLATPGEMPPPAAGHRLDRPPAERFGPGRTGAGGGSPSAGGGSPGRALAMGIVGAWIGAIIYLILAIGFSFSAGLIVVAIFTGRFIGLFVRAGAAGSLSSPARVTLAVVIFLGSMAVAILATWLAAGLEGGVLPIGQYLDEAYGTPLIALEFMLGTLVAWWSAR